MFNFSLSLKQFDKNARAYGQIIFSTFLNIGEVLGVQRYTQILDRQPREGRQRIRDFFFYPYSTRPANERDQAIADVRKDCPTLFPNDFQFAQGDSLFVAHDYLPIFSFTIAQDTKTKNLIACIVNLSLTQQRFLDSLSDPVPAFAFRCQFSRREPSGDVLSISEELTLNTPEEHNPIPEVHLSTLASGDKRASVITRDALLPRVLHLWRRLLKTKPIILFASLSRFASTTIIQALSLRNHRSSISLSTKRQSKWLPNRAAWSQPRAAVLSSFA